MRACVVVLVLAACSDLQPIEVGVCGNGVIDPDEDCDSAAADGHCVQCALKCADADPLCPAGYVCHTDGFCHAPGGVFPSEPRATASFSSSVIDYAVSDVDKDHAGDLIGVTPTSIAVSLGGEDMFATRYEALTPFGSGDPAFADFDEDGALDVLLPTRDGIAGFTSRYRALAPHAFAFDPGGSQQMDMDNGPAAIFSIDLRVIALLSVPPPISGVPQPGLYVEYLDVLSGATAPNHIPQLTCPEIVVTAGGLRYDSYLVSATATNTRAIIAVRDMPDAGPDAGPTTSHICAFMLDVDFVTGAFTTQPTFQTTDMSTTRPVLLDLDDDATVCPSLILSPTVHVRPSSAACDFAATLVPLPLAVDAVGRAPLPHAAGYAPDALVATTGLVRIKSDRTSALTFFTFDRLIDEVATGDIDSDGKTDVVVSSRTSSGVDVLFGTDIPLPPPRDTEKTFVLYRIATSGPVTHLVTGDYDGNTVDDVVYTEREASAERLVVSYGTHDRPLAPINAGRFLNIVGFLPTNVADSLDPARIIQDLAVLHAPSATDSFFLTLLHGSPQRTLVSYFDPRGTGQTGSGFTGVVTGQFALPPAAPQPIDVIAFDWRQSAKKGTLYINPGAGGGKLNETVVPGTTGMPSPVWYDTNDLTGGVCDRDRFCLEHARFVAVPRSPLDIVIGIEASSTPKTLLIDPSMLRPTSDPLASMVNNLGNVPALEGAQSSIRSLRAADVDGDGIVDVLAAFGDGVRICLSLSSCVPMSQLVPELGTCQDVAPARVQARGHFDPPLPADQPTPFVLLCTVGDTRSVYRVVHDSEGFHGDKLFDVHPSAERFQIGDVSGDGIDDILVLDREGLFPQIRAYVQCSSRDVACRGGT